MASIQSHTFMADRWGNNGNSDRFYFLGIEITADGGCSHEIKRLLLLGRKAVINLDGILKSRDISHFAKKVHIVKAMVFHYKESWALKNWCFWTVVLEKTLALDCKEIQLVHPKGNQSWILIGRTDAETKAPILWPSDAKNWLIRKNPDAGKDWRQEEKGTTEDEMVGWNCPLDGLEFEQALGVGNGRGSLTYYSPWGCKESDTTEWLHWTELIALLC